MKKLLTLLLAAVVFPLFAADFSEEDVRQAEYEALEQARAALKTAPFGGKTVAILPFQGDKSGFFTGKLKNQLTSLGFTCVEGKEDPMWDEIIREIAWDERKDDILDPATLVKFGKLKATQILLYGKIVALDKNDNRIYVEIELHATDLATKQHIWGGTFAARHYKGKDVKGIITLDNRLRMLLKKSFETARESLVSPEFAGKLNGIHSVAVLPLAGDIDEYMTGLAVEMLASTQHLPKRPGIPSLSQLRVDAKNDPTIGDAVFYGAVRDLRQSTPTVKALDRETMRESYTVSADIQLFLENTRNGNIVWSKTVTISETVVTDRPMTDDERDRHREELRENIGDTLLDALFSHWWKILLAIAAIILLFFAGKFIRAYIVNRTVR